MNKLTEGNMRVYNTDALQEMEYITTALLLRDTIRLRTRLQRSVEDLTHQGSDISHFLKLLGEGSPATVRTDILSTSSCGSATIHKMYGVDSRRERLEIEVSITEHMIDGPAITLELPLGKLADIAEMLPTLNMDKVRSMADSGIPEPIEIPWGILFLKDEWDKLMQPKVVANFLQDDGQRPRRVNIDLLWELGELDAEKFLPLAVQKLDGGAKHYGPEIKIAKYKGKKRIQSPGSHDIVAYSRGNSSYATLTILNSKLYRNRTTDLINQGGIVEFLLKKEKDSELIFK